MNTYFKTALTCVLAVILLAYALGVATGIWLRSRRDQCRLPRKQKERDPVHFFEGDAHEAPGWYFCDETWSDRLGPYETEAEARIALGEYADNL